MKHFLSQFKWYRKWKGGIWFLVKTGLPMASFWTQDYSTACQSKKLKIEDYTRDENIIS